ncbi:MAG: VWA domain-containing protein, partial [Desulfovibrionaceae bacterium]|nr:VWA domain-containing protein [Desulfovibrionaceae bacterium]
HFEWLNRKFCLNEVKFEEKAGFNDPAFSLVEYIMLTTQSWELPEVKAKLEKLGLFIDQHFPGTRQLVDPIMAKIFKDCPNTRAVIYYSKEITRLLRSWVLSHGYGDNKSGMMKGNCDSEGTRGKERARQDNNDCKLDCDEAKHDDEGSRQGDKATLQDKEVAEKSQASQSQKDLEALSELLDADGSKLPKSKDEKAEKELSKNHGLKPQHNLTVAKARNAVFGKFDEAEKEEALKASAGLRARLCGLLEAKTRSTSVVSYRGRLATKELYRVGLGTSKVFCKKEYGRGLSTAVHLLLDTSFSMHGEAITLARQSCYVLAKALAGSKGINPAISSFPAGFTDNSICFLMKHEAKLPEYLPIEAHGNTPLGPALWRILQVMLPLTEERKIILILTDGVPDDENSVLTAIQEAKKIGIEIYGIGIKQNFIKTLIPDHSQVIWNLSELTQAMFDLLQKALLKF